MRPHNFALGETSDTPLIVFLFDREIRLEYFCSIGFDFSRALGKKTEYNEVGFPIH